MAEEIENGTPAGSDRGKSGSGGGSDRGGTDSGSAGGTASGVGGAGQPDRGTDRRNETDGFAAGGTRSTDSVRGTAGTAGSKSDGDGNGGAASGNIGGGGRGRPRKYNTSGRTQKTQEGKLDNVVEKVSSSPKPTAFKDPEETKKLRATTKIGKVTPESVAQLMAAGFYMIAMSKHPYLRPAWDFEPSDLKGVAEPGAKIINKLPQKYLESFDKYADYIAFALAMNTIIQYSLEKERGLKIELTKILAEQKQSSGNARNTTNDSTPAEGSNSAHRNGNKGTASAFSPRSTDLPI